MWIGRVIISGVKRLPKMLTNLAVLFCDFRM